MVKKHSLTFVCESKDPNGDYGRATRQRQLLAAVAQKLNSTSTVFKIKDLTAVVGKYIKLTFLFQMALLFIINFLGLILLQCKRSNLKEKTKIGGIYYFLPDPNGVEAVRNEIKKN